MQIDEFDPMKIDISKIDREQFMVHQHIINGEECYLVQPQHIGATWTQETKIFRSSIWSKEGFPVSLGFPKFPNFGETPSVFPVPTDLKNAVVTNKLDGSCIICSKVNGYYIIRTRGTSDATKHENGSELEIFKERYLPSLDKMCNYEKTWGISFLFEWLTASIDHTIILKYENVPDWIFIGAIDHNDYSLFSQDSLDILAEVVGFKRPEKFKFNTVDELVDVVTNWKNKEGVVLYTNNGQTLHKIKSNDYKKKHAFKSNATLDATMELFFTVGKPALNEFNKKIGDLYDWECVQMVEDHVNNICGAWIEVQRLDTEFQTIIDNNLKQLPTRKEQAKFIMANYGASSRSSFLFKKLDGKLLDDGDYKKLIIQCLSK